MTLATPPRLLARVLAWLLPPASREDVLGDLQVEYVRRRQGRRLRANLWYLSQCVSIGLPFAWLRVTRSLATGAAADLGHAARGLRRRPGLVAVAITSLGLGIGLAIAVFSVVNGLLFVPLPYASPDGLVEIDETHPTEVCQGCSVFDRRRAACRHPATAGRCG